MYSVLGKLLHDRYKVVQLLSAQGLCSTYIAQDTYLPHQPSCIVKHFHASSNDAESLLNLRQLFQREVEALAKLQCDCIPRLLAYFEDNQQFYLVQEYIIGNRLSAELLPGEKWDESRVVRMLQEVLRILAYIHSNGLIHRDITPNNIIRRQQDQCLVLVNFSTVKQTWTQVVTLQGKTSSSLISIPATIAIGTPGYLPPEQARGKPYPNSDIYALGIIGIQALTGVNPTQLLEDTHTGQIIWHAPGEISPLQQVLDKMVRYSYQERYQSATEVLQALQQRVAQTSRTQKQPLQQTNSTPLGTNKSGLIIAMLTGVTAAVAFIIGSYYYFWQPPSATPKQNYSITVPQRTSET